MKTADLLDEYENQLESVNVNAYRRYGTKVEFGGEIHTVRCFEDNTTLKRILSTDGSGKVLVVDGGGSWDRALMGGNVATLAARNDWEGVVIHGCVRDSAEINDVAVAVVALGTAPRRPRKEGEGEENVVVQFADASFVPGRFLYCDEDGLVLSENDLSNPIRM